MLTKSQFLSGCACEKRLWLELHKPEEGKSRTEGTEERLEDGLRVGTLARTVYPGGVLIEAKRIAEAVEETKKAIAEGAETIFEGAFAVGGLVARGDVLERKDSGWKLTEVKGSTKIEEKHLLDIAYQAHVLKEAGLNVASAAILHINNKSTYEDLPQIFSKEEVTAHVTEREQIIKEKKASLLKLLEEKEEPKALLRKDCKKECLFHGYCFKDVPRFSLFTVPGPFKERDSLVAQGILAIADLPKTTKLSVAQMAYIEAVLTKTPKIDKQAIKVRLNELQYPLYFFDIETYSSALPLYPGMHPYEKLPFQFSCHVMQEDGTLSHYEFLHEDKCDPRNAFTETLLSTIGFQGSVIVYSAQFERGALEKLAAVFPEHAEELQHIIQRLFDQLELFKKHYLHPEFLGSNSIKSVLPALTGRSYAELDLQKGDDAGALWLRMLETDNVNEKGELKRMLLEYCGLDTEAMVEIHKHLQAL